MADDLHVSPPQSPRSDDGRGGNAAFAPIRPQSHHAALGGAMMGHPPHYHSQSADHNHQPSLSASSTHHNHHPRKGHQQRTTRGPQGASSAAGRQHQHHHHERSGDAQPQTSPLRASLANDMSTVYLLPSTSVISQSPNAHSLSASCHHQLCASFSADGRCSAGNACPDLHAKLDQATVIHPHIRGPPSGNQPCFRADTVGDRTVRVTAPNAPKVSDEVRLQDCLATHAPVGSASADLKHCAHWLLKGSCDFGAACRFIHALHPSDAVLQCTREQREAKEKRMAAAATNVTVTKSESTLTPQQHAVDVRLPRDSATGASAPHQRRQRHLQPVRTTPTPTTSPGAQGFERSAPHHATYTLTPDSRPAGPTSHELLPLPAPALETSDEHDGFAAPDAPPQSPPRPERGMVQPAPQPYAGRDEATAAAAGGGGRRTPYVHPAYNAKPVRVSPALPPQP